MQTLEVSLEKFSHNKLNIISVGSGLLNSLKRVKRTAQDYGVRINSPEFFEPETVIDDSKTNYRYISKILLKKKGNNFSDARNNLETVEYELIKKAEANGWRLCSTTPIGEKVSSIVNTAKIRPKFMLSKMTDNLIDKYFGEELYDMNHLVRLIHDSISLFQLTEGQKRFHTLLFGPPACGKTSVLLKLKELYEQEDLKLRLEQDNGAELVERVTVVDGTSFTKAGIIADFVNRSNEQAISEIFLIEEIEKCAQAPEALSWLLSVLDQRGQLTKITFRQNICLDTKIICWATSNDIEKLKSILSGSLYSRFTNQYHCTRPSIELIKLILKREIKQIPGGNIEWIDRAIDLGKNVIKTNDCRVFISLLSGRDRIMTKEFKDDLIKTLEKINN